MASIELLADQRPRWKKGTDLLDLQAPVQVVVNGNPLPPAHYPRGLPVRLYETSFEILDLLENVVKAVLKDGPGAVAGPFHAEFCYTSTYLVVELPGTGVARVGLQFNPAVVDDEALLAGTMHKEDVDVAQLLAELLHFPIAVHETILDFDPTLEASLDDLQAIILMHQERLVEIFPDDEG